MLITLILNIKHKHVWIRIYCIYIYYVSACHKALCACIMVTHHVVVDDFLKALSTFLKKLLQNTL